jgi:hypothetical protein
MTPKKEIRLHSDCGTLSELARECEITRASMKEVVRYHKVQPVAWRGTHALYCWQCIQEAVLKYERSAVGNFQPFKKRRAQIGHKP